MYIWFIKYICIVLSTKTFLSMGNQQHRSIKLQSKYVSLAYRQTKQVPELRISGLWLDQCGFHAGDMVDIAIVDGELLIKAKLQ